MRQQLLTYFFLGTTANQGMEIGVGVLKLAGTARGNYFVNQIMLIFADLKK